MTKNQGHRKHLGKVLRVLKGDSSNECDIKTYVKQKKSVVEPTRKKVAADTGTYRDGRRGLLCETTAWGSGDEDGTRPPL